MTPDASAVEQLRGAFHRRDARAIRHLFEEHPELRQHIDQPVFGFDSPAIVAYANDLPMVELLLELGADPNRRSDWWAGGFHPLHSATGGAAERLLAAGAVPDACAAAQLGRLDLLARMIGENSARVHERGGDGQTPLHFARSRAVVDMLLDAGADPDAKDVDHRSTPAEWMLGDMNSPKPRNDIARYLVERGAKADIFLAAALGLTDQVRQLLAADPSLLLLRTGQGDYGEKPPSSFHIYLWTLGSNLSPLHVAAERGQVETVEVMKAFATPAELLLLACRRGDGAEARSIIREHPGLLDELSPVQRRALTDEAWGGNSRAVELLLEMGFDPAVPSASGPTGGNALHCAAWEGSVDSVAAILRYPAGRA